MEYCSKKHGLSGAARFGPFIHKYITILSPTTCATLFWPFLTAVSLENQLGADFGQILAVGPLFPFFQSSRNIDKLYKLQVSADWVIDSQWLNLLRVPLEGKIHAQMTGLISEIAMQVHPFLSSFNYLLQVTPEHEVEVHHCVAQIRDLRLNLDGSLAAEVLQWFRNSVTRSIRKRLEEVLFLFY